MKRISTRSMVLLLLIALMLLGTLFFVGKYFLFADDWVVFPGSPHVYAGGNLSTGVITDRAGTLLLDSTDGRTYSQDVELRKATMHLLGDRYGYIEAPVPNAYADRMIGYSKITGVHHLTDAPAEARMTISAPVQKAALAAMAGKKGTIGVYNYKTGEILCAVTTPTYDPDNMPDVEADTTGAYSGVYLNRFFRTSFVPGSIFKVITAAAALETLPDAQTRSFYCEGSCEISGQTIHCNGTHYTQTLSQALANSCNVAFAQLSVELGKNVLTKYVEKLGVVQSLTFDGMTTAAGSFDVSRAMDSELGWAGIGQYTDLVNPCRFMAAMGAIAADGRAAKPYLMAEVTGSYKAKTELLPRALDADTCAVLAEYMRNNVVTMYGQWQFPDLYVCAKSGTAELSEGETPHATFAGFIKDDNYPLAFIVIVEHGGSGSATCAPIAGQVLNAACQAMDAERA